MDLCYGITTTMMAGTGPGCSTQRAHSESMSVPVFCKHLFPGPQLLLLLEMSVRSHPALPTDLWGSHLTLGVGEGTQVLLKLTDPAQPAPSSSSPSLTLLQPQRPSHCSTNIPSISAPGPLHMLCPLSMVQRVRMEPALELDSPTLSMLTSLHFPCPQLAGGGGTHFMHPEYCWQRATGTRTTQRGKAASRPPEAASSSRLSSRCPVSPPSDCPHLGVSRLVRLKGNTLSPCPLALALGLCQASPVRPVGLKFLQEDTGPCGTRGTGVGPDKELEDCACLGPQEDNGLVAPGAGAHVHGHSCQLVPRARVEQSQAAAQPP